MAKNHNGMHAAVPGEGTPAKGWGPQAQAGGNSAPTGAPPSNTAPASYIPSEIDIRILRYGVDSLYLSYPGSLGRDWAQRLEGLKLAAQSQEEAEQALAQVKIGDHLFEVLGRGRGKFAFVLADNCFQIALSGPQAKSLPLAYVQIASEYLTALGVEEAEKRLRFIVNTFGAVTAPANISRVDLFVDFTADLVMDSWGPEAWVTRAQDIKLHYPNGRFSGWGIGFGGAILARFYDKTLELMKSRKDYLLPLWMAAGWDGEIPVWRLEFQFNREVLQELGVSGLAHLMPNLCGLWHYATASWLRLTLPNPQDDNRTRWPTHPLWETLSGLDWGQADAPTLARVRKARVPSDDSLFINGLGSITSFMAREGITDLGEGFGEFLAHAHRFHEHRGHMTGTSFKKYINGKVANKGRKYNTLKNKSAEEEEAKKARAQEYRRAKDGE